MLPSSIRTGKLTVNSRLVWRRIPRISSLRRSRSAATSNWATATANGFGRPESCALSPFGTIDLPWFYDTYDAAHAPRLGPRYNAVSYSWSHKLVAIGSWLPKLALQ